MVEQLERRSTFTRSQQDYLKALYLLGGDERPVPTRDLALRQQRVERRPWRNRHVDGFAVPNTVSHDARRCIGHLEGVSGAVLELAGKIV